MGQTMQEFAVDFNSLRDTGAFEPKSTFAFAKNISKNTGRQDWLAVDLPEKNTSSIDVSVTFQVTAEAQNAESEDKFNLSSVPTMLNQLKKSSVSVMSISSCEESVSIHLGQISDKFLPDDIIFI